MEKEIERKICERLFMAIDALSTLVSIGSNSECSECLNKLQDEFEKCKN